MILNWSQPKIELTVKEFVRIYLKLAKNVPWMHLFIHLMQDQENQKLIPSGTLKIIFTGMSGMPGMSGNGPNNGRNGRHQSSRISSSELNMVDVQKLDSYH